MQDSSGCIFASWPLAVLVDFLVGVVAELHAATVLAWCCRGVFTAEHRGACHHLECQVCYLCAGAQQLRILAKAVRQMNAGALHSMIEVLRLPAPNQRKMKRQGPDLSRQL